MAVNDGALGEMAPTTLVLFASGVSSYVKQPIAFHPVEGIEAES